MRIQSVPSDPAPKDEHNATQYFVDDVISSAQCSDDCDGSHVPADENIITKLVKEVG